MTIFRALVVLFLPVLWAILPPCLAETNRTPKELPEYTLAPKKHGMKDEEIKRNAVKAGGPAIALAAEEATTANALSQQPSNRADRTTIPAAASSQSSGPPAVGRQATPGDHGVPPDYQIGAGDLLQIVVWKEPDASVQSVIVRPDGKVGMPLLKEVSVAGLTPTQAEGLIAEQLSKLIPSPDVTVVVTGINSKKVYMVGAVGKEGPIPLLYRMTVFQALNEAGGLSPYAKRKKIYILRTLGGKNYRFKFNYNQVIKGERLEQDIPLMPNDRIIVPH